MNTKKEVIAKLAEHHVVCKFNKDHVLLTYAGNNERIYTDSSLTTIYEKGVAHRDAVLARRREQEQEAAQRRAEQQREKARARLEARNKAEKERSELVEWAHAELTRFQDVIGSGEHDAWRVHSFFSAAVGLVESGERQIGEFSVLLQTNPFYAMEWSSNMFTTAAEMELGCYILAAFRHCVTERNKSYAEIRELLIEEFKKDIVRMAESSSRSTSFSSNEMERSKLAARAKACSVFFS